MGGGDADAASAFESFVVDHEPRLRRALVAAYGVDAGREATAEALAWAWEHWDRMPSIANPVAYLYKVGQSRSRRRMRRALTERPAAHDEPLVEPGLARALAALTEQQRVAVGLVHGYGWTLREVGELLGIRVTSVQNHVERGLAKLRERLEVDDA